MFNKRQRREFEQKAARETKAIGSWVSVMVIRSGLRRLSNRPPHEHLNTGRISLIMRSLEGFRFSTVLGQKSHKHASH